MSSRLFTFARRFVVLSLALMAADGCATRTHLGVVTGQFFVLKPSCKIVVTLASGSRLHETVSLPDGTSQVIEGHWKINGRFIELAPFLDLQQNTPVLYHQWRALAQYDLYGDLNWFSPSDERIYFERVHPLTLAAGPTYSAPFQTEPVYPNA